MANIPSVEEKCIGSFLASAIGDALGWPNEFKAENAIDSKIQTDFFVQWNRRTGGRYWSHVETIAAGEYSDDTQMILAVARSLMSDDWKVTFSKKELPMWLDYERGGGRAVKQAARSWRNGKEPWESKDSSGYFGAGGNGAVMRILPHVIFAYGRQGLDGLLNDVVEDCLFTHGHVRAILGATCYAYALYKLLQKREILGFGQLVDEVIEGAEIWGKFPQEVVAAEWLERAEKTGKIYENMWMFQVGDMLQKLQFIKDSLKKGLLVKDRDVLKRLESFDKSKGAGDVAILSALFFASKYANNPALGIKAAAFCYGTDTDTIASITGGLLGMLCGVSWIPSEWKLVQDYDCLVNFPRLLLTENIKEETKRVTDYYRAKSNDWIPSLIGKIRILNTNEISGKSFVVHVKKTETLSGQTMFFKTYERMPKEMIETDVVETKMLKLEKAYFVLELEDISQLLSNHSLGRITLKKFLNILKELLEKSEPAKIAKKYKVDEEIVVVVRNLINNG